ncbi:hypothetical protein HHI36_011791 [Cryptolaemus montrouzieri]|uniref:Uncharacterized protein n=1 Tax=Cryptolaemus montrouzieri TaxID=559131 RepID=A0ABD2NCP7_9CUCU
MEITNTKIDIKLTKYDKSNTPNEYIYHTDDSRKENAVGCAILYYKTVTKCNVSDIYSIYTAELSNYGYKIVPTECKWPSSQNILIEKKTAIKYYQTREYANNLKESENIVEYFIRVEIQIWRRIYFVI